VLAAVCLALAGCGATEGTGAGAGPQLAGEPHDASIEEAPTIRPPPAPLPPPPEGSGALSAFDRLPVLDLAAQSRHSSSYDRTGGNVDYGNTLGTDAAGDLILLDARGPGCVYRFWMTNFPDDSRIHIYFDDEPTARIDMTLKTFFGDGAPAGSPFSAPLVGDFDHSSGGYFSYVPIAFAKSLRITVTDYAYDYFNIDYHALPADRAIASWTGHEDLSAARSAWSAAGTDPKRIAGALTATMAFDADPGTSEVLFDGDGPAELTSLEVSLPSLAGLPPFAGADAGTPEDGGLDAADGGADAGADASVSPAPVPDGLDTLWVSIAWDRETTPSVLAPVGSLFAVGGHRPAGPAAGLMAGLRPDGTLYLYFPMPFATHAHVELQNRGPMSVPAVTARVARAPFPYAFDAVGTFAVQYGAGPSTAGADLTLLETTGSGKIVGVVLDEGRACAGCAVIRDYLEGDEHALLDGARTPVVIGTGTEDFFNGGFYFYRGPFALPTHGNVSHVAGTNFDSTSAYRFFVSDAIGFRDGARLSLQHGPADDDDVQAETLVYYYRQPRTRLERTDEFALGDAVAESAHAYRCDEPSRSGTLTATFEGEFDDAPSEATGLAHPGSSFFVMAVDPSNEGVVLRRLLNQAIGNQHAQVFVDGALAGEWLSAGSNQTHAWREDDFLIPASASTAKSRLSIEIRVVPSDSSWTEFEYQALSRLP
jgi:hypothetical protein